MTLTDPAIGVLSATACLRQSRKKFALKLSLANWSLSDALIGPSAVSSSSQRKASNAPSPPEVSTSRGRARQAHRFSRSGVLPVRLNENAYALRRHGLGKQVSLGRPTTGLRQQLVLVRCFHPFSDHFKFQITRQPDDGFNDGIVSAIHRFNERLIDFQRIHWEASEIAQRGISRAKIVDTQPHS